MLCIVPTLSSNEKGTLLFLAAAPWCLPRPLQSCTRVDATAQRGLGRIPSQNRIRCVLALKCGIWWQQLQWFSRNCTDQTSRNQSREDFCYSRPWPWAYFLNGPNAACRINSTHLNPALGSTMFSTWLSVCACVPRRRHSQTGLLSTSSILLTWRTAVYCRHNVFCSPDTVYLMWANDVCELCVCQSFQ